LRLQVENKGFSFVEVLAECPTHLKMTPVEAERWVQEQMVPVFPLGVKKDVDGGGWGDWAVPTYEPGPLLEALETRPRGPLRRSAPPRLPPAGLGIKLAGAGGDGAQTAAALIARAAIEEGLDATHIPCYGPESRGGTSFADVRVAAGEVLSPEVPAPDALVAFNAPSLARFGPAVVPGGVVIHDSSVVPAPQLGERVRVVGVPCSRIAAELGAPVVKNMVALGALQAAAGLLGEATFLATIRDALAKNAALAELNLEAFRRGAAAAITQ